MTLEQFHEYLDKQPISDKLVNMRYKYSWEDIWTYSNEILEVNDRVDGYYEWLSDWNEGQEDIEILGCIAVDEIKVTPF